MKNDFINYLKSVGVSESSLKHYLSDLSIFTYWITNKVKAYGLYIESLQECIPVIDAKTGKEYKDYLKSTSKSLKTLNRRLSSIRQLSKFLIQSQMTDFDIMKGVSNESSVRKQSPTHSLLILYREHLKKNKVSDSTIKNYLSDIRQFLFWAEQKKVQDS